MENEAIAKELLEEIDLRVENIEERLSIVGRFKRRWWNKKVVFGYVVGGNVTLVQLTVGKKILAWAALKAPWLFTWLAKVWGAITSTALGIIHWG